MPQTAQTPTGMSYSNSDSPKTIFGHYSNTDSPKALLGVILILIIPMLSWDVMVILTVQVHHSTSTSQIKHLHFRYLVWWISAQPILPPHLTKKRVKTMGIKP